MSYFSHFHIGKKTEPQTSISCLPVSTSCTRSIWSSVSHVSYRHCHASFHALTKLATGSAGLINTIASFSQGHIVAGVFGLLASIGWILQAAGGGILYKRVGLRCAMIWPVADLIRCGTTRMGMGTSLSKLLVAAIRLIRLEG